MAAFSVGQTTHIASLEMWDMQAANEGFLQAQADPVWLPDEL